MSHKEKNAAVYGTTMLFLIFLNALILKIAFIENQKWYALLFITLPLLLVGIYYNVKNGGFKSEQQNLNRFL